MSLAKDDTLQNAPPVQSPQKRAAGWQIALTMLAAVTIVAISLWGVTNQRSESGAGAERKRDSQSATPAQAQPADSNGRPAQAHGQ